MADLRVPVGTTIDCGGVNVTIGGLCSFKSAVVGKNDINVIHGIIQDIGRFHLIASCITKTVNYNFSWFEPADMRGGYANVWCDDRIPLSGVDATAIALDGVEILKKYD